MILRIIGPYIMPALIAACVALAGALAWQTWRLERCQVKADRLDTCLEVDKLEKEARDASDDDLVDSISIP